MNSTNKRMAKIFIIIYLFILFSNAVSAAKVDITFTTGTANTAPSDPLRITLQDGFENTEQCFGGQSWDVYTDDNNLTTHMLNASLIWGKGTDAQGDTIKTFICVTNIYANLQTLTKQNESNNTKCSVINAWSEASSIEDNTTGIILNQNFTVLNITYNGTHNDYYGAMMSWDNTAGANNRSEITYFNFTILNRPPQSAASFAPSSTHDTTPDISWTAAYDPEDGTGADLCPKDSLTYNIQIGDMASGQTSRLNVNITTNSYTWSATALDYNFTLGSGSTIRDYYFRINATDNLIGTIQSKYDGKFTLRNDIPSVASNLKLNNTAGLLHSHSPGPRTDWSSATDTDAGDLITYNISVSTIGATGPYNLVANHLTASTQNFTFFDARIPWGNILNDGNWTNKTVYIRMFAYDDKQLNLSEGAYDIIVQLTNSIPDIPANFNTTATHDQTPNVAWAAATDADGDKITYKLKVGSTNYGDRNYEDSSQINIYETIDAAIPWGSDGQETGWNNNTVYVSLQAVDSFNLNISQGYLNQTMQLTDYMPNIIHVNMTDTTTSYGACTESVCTFNPLSYTNISLAVEMTIRDIDNDCGTNHPTLYLCLNSTSNQKCNTANNVNFSWKVETGAISGENCIWRFGSNLTAVNSTPPFFIPAGNYKFNVNAPGGYGSSRGNDNEANGTWSYGTLSSVNYTSSIILGGGTVYLGIWNFGTNEYIMKNVGNNVLDIRWNTTYLGLADANFNWTPDGTDYLIDDDNSQSAEGSSLISPVYLTENDSYFNHSTGLEICTAFDCNNSAVNETMPTYFHIKPPLGLLPGVYSGTLTYNVETH
ncbi:hypothetical protein J4418_05070 [Candidatus Woesearchaeota archaeon]|nr:hypothetical protein [Candidatus Woesearchaeota archaeon]